MGEEFVGGIDEEIIVDSKVGKEGIQKVKQEQIHGLLFGEQLSWQSIIYDLINTEQLDPWDIDLSLLAHKFLEKVKLLEEANFFVSSKVLFAASLLLRMKSERLIDIDLKNLDDILFGKKENKVYVQERMELDEDIPELVVRSPLPRFKKVTLEELMNALGHAIKTETRRIHKVVEAKQQEYEVELSLPKKRINIQDSIKKVYGKLQEVFEKREDELAFSELAGNERENKIATFIPLLHLDNQHKVWLKQEKHFDEIWILLKELYEKKNSVELESMKKEVDEAIREFEKDEAIAHQEEQKMNEAEEEKDNEREKGFKDNRTIDEREEEPEVNEKNERK